MLLSIFEIDQAVQDRQELLRRDADKVRRRGAAAPRRKSPREGAATALIALAYRLQPSLRPAHA
ncbi:MAG TPA: hypothetical protein VFW96_28370 [Thermomicrobiales bacterium]|nr:hypothetical protein [Thermomicrobiales bacterium]